MQDYRTALVKADAIALAIEQVSDMAVRYRVMSPTAIYTMRSASVPRHRQ